MIEYLHGQGINGWNSKTNEISLDPVEQSWSERVTEQPHLNKHLAIQDLDDCITVIYKLLDFIWKLLFFLLAKFWIFINGILYQK